MRAEVREASKAGIFGVILIALSSLLLGLLCRLFSLDPIIYFACMAGVLFPMGMIAAGMLSRWVSEICWDIPQDIHRNSLGSSLTAGVVTAFGGSLAWLFTIVLTLNDMFPVGRLSSTLTGPGPGVFIELAVLLAAYMALSVIGGILYGIVVPEEKGLRF